ncbi:MAG: chemotaxis protein CheA [Spirochaetales bacterium]|nr:chemotaxis protein CheA [Spirochaetales bacterium]
MSDYLDPNNEELLKDFFSEAQGQVDLLEQNILVLENDPGNRDAVDEIFRAAHTLKGGSSTVEMTELAEFTHLIEDLLDDIRADKVRVDGGLVDALLAAIDIVKEMLDKRMAGSRYAGDTAGVKVALSAYRASGPAKQPAAAKSRPPQAAPQSRPSAPVAVPEPKATARAESVPASGLGLSEYELLELKESASGKPVWRVEIDFDESNVMNTVSAIHAFAAMRDAGTVLKTEPDFEKLYEDTFHPTVRYFVATDADAAELERRAMIPDVSIAARVASVAFEGASRAEPDQAPVTPRPQGAAATPKPAPAARPAPAPAAAAAPSGAVGELQAELAKAGLQREAADDEHAHDSRKPGQQGGSILRVDSRRIDNLLNLVSEAVINKATFNQISSQFGDMQNNLSIAQSTHRDKLKELFDALPEYLEAIRQGRPVKEVKKEVLERFGGLFAGFDAFEAEYKTNAAKFRATAQNLGRITGDLQEGVMRIRMVPISQIFSRFPRLVRDLSRTLQKKVELRIEGEETELDKSVIEDLLDPLMHAVRNALDHGVETPDERIKAGKEEEGTVLLKASNEGNMIIIEISDDGKGIDVEAVKKKAVERGILHPSKVLTDNEAFALIFEPGFSTAKSVTNISGRGVGLDVVKRQIEKLNGSVSVSSQRGKSTRFIIKLPLTLAIIQGLLVRVGKEIYSIPITSVVESHRIKPSEIRMIDNYEVFNVRNDVVSLLRLDRLFRIRTSEQREYNFVVIVGTSDKKVGLMVDSLIGEEDVVIKPLRDQYTNSPGIAGASILGDGSVCLIIDVSQLLELGLKRELEERRRLEMTIR